jgi:hypothetical protein
VKCAEALWSFIGCAGFVFVVRRLCVSMFVCFIAAISIAFFYACSLSCFFVFAVNTSKSFFIFLVSSSCFRSRLGFLSVEGGVYCYYSSSLASGLAWHLVFLECGLSCPSR